MTSSNVPDNLRERTGHGPLPPALFLVSLIVEAGLHLAFPLWRLFPWPWSLTGLLPLAAGLAVTIAADQQFKRAQTTVHPFGRPTTLVTDGVFAVSRNPMYLGLVLILAGVAVLLGTTTPWLLPPLFAFLLSRRFIRAEEAELRRVLGEGYEPYARRVRRWL